MFISRWLRRTNRPKPSHRLDICVLEDRITPALYRQLPPPPPPPATHLQVIVPQDVVPGQAFKVIVEAENAKNQLVPSFRGTVHLNLGSADTGATFPATFTFTAADAGKHTIQMKLTAPGAQTVKAASGSLFGQSTLTVDGPVTHFAISAPSTTYAGVSFTFTVSALDANNHTVPGYTGTVHVTSTDPMASLPTDYTFQASDKGSHTFFSTTLNSVAIQTLTVSVASNRTMAASAQVQVISPYTTYSNPFAYGYGSFGLGAGMYGPYYGMVVGASSGGYFWW